MNRDKLISSMGNIEGGSNPQNTDSDSAITNEIIDLCDNGSSSDEKKIIKIIIL